MKPAAKAAAPRSSAELLAWIEHLAEAWAQRDERAYCVAIGGEKVALAGTEPHPIAGHIFTAVQHELQGTFYWQEIEAAVEQLRATIGRAA